MLLPGGSWVPSGDFNPIRLSTVPETRFCCSTPLQILFHLHPGGFEHRNPGPAAGVKRESTEWFWQSLDGPGVSKSCPLH